MAFTTFRTWTPGEVVTAAMFNAQIRDNGNSLAVVAQHLNKGGNICSIYGITATGQWMAWRAPFACTATKVTARRPDGGGSSTTVNAYRNFTDLLMASNLDLAAQATEYSSTSLQNEVFEPGDWLSVAIMGVAGSPTQVYIEVEFDALAG